MIARHPAALTQPLAGRPWPPALQTIARRPSALGAIARWVLAAAGPDRQIAPSR